MLVLLLDFSVECCKGLWREGASQWLVTPFNERLAFDTEVVEASEMHRLAQLSNIQFRSKDEINDPDLDSTARYNRTKLAMILFAKYGLAGKVIQENNDRIYALSVHPGAVSHFVSIRA